MVTVQPKGGLKRPITGIAGLETADHTGSATSLSGTPWDLVLTFGFTRRAVRVNWLLWLQNALARGVSQTRLESGEIMLQAAKGELCRVEWDVRDRRNNTLYQESAVGFIEVTASSIARYEEAYTMTLYRGDFYLSAAGERVYWGTP